MIKALPPVHRTAVELNNEYVLKIVSTCGEVATFLLNTGRALQAIEVCKGCLILLKNIPHNAQDQFTKAVYHGLYCTILRANYVISDYATAAKYAKRLRDMFHNSGDLANERKLTLGLAEIYQKLSMFLEAKELYGSVIDYMKLSGDKEGEAICYLNLGAVVSSLGEYQKAIDYLKKSLSIRRETNDKKGEATTYVALGRLPHLIGDHHKAKKYLERALVIATENNSDRQVEAEASSTLGDVFSSLGQYRDAMEKIENALDIRIKICDRNGEADDYERMGAVDYSIGNFRYHEAKENHQRALNIRRDIGNRKGVATSYNHLGTVFLAEREFVEAEKYFMDARKLSIQIGDKMNQLKSLCGLSELKLLQCQEKCEEVSFYLSQCIKKYESLRSFSKDDDYFQVCFSERYSSDLIKLVSKICCCTGHPENGLYIEELIRGRALADLMSSQYSVEIPISADQQSWYGIEKVVKNERNCTCLYISYREGEVFLWAIKTSGNVYFRKLKVKEKVTFPFESEDLFENLSREIDWHDHDFIYDIYNIVITPMIDLLTEPEIIIVPDRFLYRVPFAALRDEGSGKRLAESLMIRIVPSLLTLKLIQDSPGDYLRQTGALIVGDPEVGEVILKGRRRNVNVLPSAKKEAETIARIIGVHPLIGRSATKEAVLRVISDVSMIHIAADGDAEKGEILLSPNRTTDTFTPSREEDFLMTMSDISQVRIRAKLVVLSCCHSGRGAIKAEGVIGIARAFLGSGARSVFSASCAIEDTSTELLMSRFYENLITGKSASESHHEAMKWMRNNGYTKVPEWASFMLIGDNVAFDFKTTREDNRIYKY